MNDPHPDQLDPLLLARLLCTRLCHDMAAPVGAVANGAELMGGDPAMVDAETLGLLTDSAAAASLRLRTLRAAFGLRGALEAADVPRLIQGWVATRTTVMPPAPEALTRLAADDLQVLLNLALVAHDAALAPTTLTVTVEPGATVVMTAEATGRGARSEQGLAEAVAGAPEGVGPRTVQGWLVGALARQRGGQVAYAEIAGGVRLTGTLPLPTG
ncbi:histidine phosphotransferase family protein [Caenispirillum salinarum]|uniref:histidine phosphotransferase family protein n=1 Tax=Caenispirillum salinarum TaxID=859058 RepID=UPI00384BECAF